MEISRVTMAQLLITEWYWGEKCNRTELFGQSFLPISTNPLPFSLVSFHSIKDKLKRHCTRIYEKVCNLEPSSYFGCNIPLVPLMSLEMEYGNFNWIGFAYEYLLGWKMAQWFRKPKRFITTYHSSLLAQ